MPFTSSRRWLPASNILAGPVLLLLFLLPSPMAAQEHGPTMLLRPHCAQDEILGVSPCALFPTRDPLTQETPLLQNGEALDMDLIIQNPLHQEINRVRAWIAYDPTILEGVTLSLAKSFPLPSPSEADFSQEEGYVKIQVSADAGGRTEDTMVVARIQMRVIATPSASTTLSFYDAGTLPENHTNIFRGSGLLEQSVLNPSSLGQLNVRLQKEVPAETPTDQAPPPPPFPNLPPTSLHPVDQPTEVFTLLQVQNLRITTEGSSVFLAWNSLPSSQLIGYNLYYGTVSGEYLQRRSMDSATTSMTLRSLPPNRRYFFAIRGVSDTQTETAFGQEVTITVGNPGSSSAPLRGNITERERTVTHPARALVGRTGTPSLFLMVVLGSACVGTAFACRRQCVAPIRHP
ncbi:fibronectin type III domain-containing protein [Candidatus Peregrinibacteria bacterium]|nr:fibronectin type III domain-containing protein [Candidatus Peregrinibacteria bacterium]